ncbi:MAG: hypothetical protein V3V08_10975 [Nannocystaceae bacterium]
MAESPDQLVKSVPTLVKKQDVEALARLEVHVDKKIRKAARRGLHQLRSRGVEVPETQSSAWRAEAEMTSLRGDTQSTALLDVVRYPGSSEFVLVDVHGNGSTLCAAVISPHDRVLACQIYGQTDGQRNRMFRSWERSDRSRRLPIEWARQRLHWARQVTVAHGVAVSSSMDRMVASLGDAPTERPVCFLGDLLKDQVELNLGAYEMLVRGQCLRWPLQFPIPPLLQRVGDEYVRARKQPADVASETSKASDASEAPDPSGASEPGEPLSEEAHAAVLIRASRGDEAFRKALRGPMANLLDDAAVAGWLRGEEGLAKLLLDAASELRAADEPELLPVAPRILRFQVAMFAAETRRQQAAAGGSDETSEATPEAG